ncbi:MAG TPA: ABC transporter ATP-binding protein [Microbacteriaceae bacterium]|nr:ABC transporter ATP-binding protein [Microbacteriaceae bacterium]
MTKATEKPATAAPTSRARPAGAAHATLEARQVRLGYGGEPIIDGLDLAVIPGAITAIVGANASGKSTLLRGLDRLLTPQGGTVLLDGANIAGLPPRRVARRVAILPQAPTAPDGITVGDLVARGRFPHQGWFRRRSADDERAVAAALAATTTQDLAWRPMDALSGGQRQRVWLAMALAQETDILLLDEPTTYLDIAHQVELLDLVATLNEERGCTVVMVLHDLNQAARYADHLVAMRGGQIVAAGPPGEIVTEQMVRRVFGMECRVLRDPVEGTPVIIPAGRRRRARVAHDTPTARDTPATHSTPAGEKLPADEKALAKENG